MVMAAPKQDSLLPLSAQRASVLYGNGISFYAEPGMGCSSGRGATWRSLTITMARIDNCCLQIEYELLGTQIFIGETE
jgi:hypothetical protein